MISILAIAKPGDGADVDDKATYQYGLVAWVKAADGRGAPWHHLRRRLWVLCMLLLLSVPLLLTHLPAAAQDAAPGPDDAHLSLLVLGSGGPGATGRAGAGYLVALDGQPRILVDAGPGTFVRAGEAGVDLSQVDTVLLTHLHVDHAGELSGLIKARLVS